MLTWIDKILFAGMFAGQLLMLVGIWGYKNEYGLHEFHMGVFYVGSIVLLVCLLIFGIKQEYEFKSLKKKDKIKKTAGQ